MCPLPLAGEVAATLLLVVLCLGAPSAFAYRRNHLPHFVGEDTSSGKVSHYRESRRPGRKVPAVERSEAGGRGAIGPLQVSSPAWGSGGKLMLAGEGGDSQP